MSRTRAAITQAEVARILRAAKQVGAREVEVINRNGERVVVRLGDRREILDAPEEIVL